MSIIDTHVHFWEPATFHYRWLPTDHPLHKPFLPEHVVNEMEKADVDGCIVIEAANTTDEIAWLLEFAERYPFILGVMCWLDWDKAGINTVVEQYKDNPYFRGARFNWIENSWDDIAQVQANLAQFDRYGLTCDVLTRIDLLPEALDLIRPHTNTHFVINHFAGATLSPDGAHTWAKQMAPLANLPNISMKFSGYMTACEPCPITVTTLASYLQVALEIFGDERLLFATNYPVNEMVGGDYATPITLLEPVLNQLTPQQRKNLLCDNARRAYRLPKSLMKDT